KAFTSLTKVQEAVLDPALAGRDLRISSQTGSGKTVAIGLALRHELLETREGGADARDDAFPVASTDPARGDANSGLSRPRALVVVPTRELAKQVEQELAWLYAPAKVRIASVTGGSSYREERRALASDPAVVVGTPGRLLDHLRRGAIDPSGL